MKKYFFLLLISAALGVCYFYSTDEVFRAFVTAQIEKLRSADAVDTTGIPQITVPDGKETKGHKKKIAKILKPDEFAALDKYARNTPVKYETSIPVLANYLVKPAHNDLEKARTLFVWVATHIHYDDDGFNNDKIGDCSAEAVLKTKKSVCEGYSSILKELCLAGGLEAEKISGYSKAYGYSPGDKVEVDHAWNAIKIDGQWRLFDATWAQGYGDTKNNKLVSVAKFNPYWFNVNPKEFIFTHLPEEAKWQLTDIQIPLSRYQTLPWLRGHFFKLKFNANDVFTDAVRSRVKSFVTTYDSDFSIRAIQLPYNRQLQKGKELTLILYSEYVEEMVLIEGGEWINFEKDGNLFKLKYTPKGKECRISYKINWFDKNYNGLAEYK